MREKTFVFFGLFVMGKCEKTYVLFWFLVLYFSLTLEPFFF